MSTGKMYDNCSYKIGVLLVGFLLTDFRSLLGHQSFQRHHHNIVAHHDWDMLIHLLYFS